eukprot:12884094-Prorocentrum_lima.AAC.1
MRRTKVGHLERLVYTVFAAYVWGPRGGSRGRYSAVLSQCQVLGGSDQGNTLHGEVGGCSQGGGVACW